jgi:ParB/RepB/Spo0J family partition protein
MSKRKKFGASASTMQAISDSIEMGEGRDQRYQNVEMKTDYVELDPNNPRKLSISRRHIKGGVTPKTPVEKEEYQMIKDLALSIEESGLINPITLVRLSSNQYRVIAGECRFLAFLMNGKSTIPARVFSTKPNSFELKKIQWEENTKRKDLSLYERLDNIRILIEAYLENNPNEVNDYKLVKKITGLSQTPASRYNTVIKSNKLILEAVRENIIKDIVTAYNLASSDLSEKGLKIAIDDLRNNGGNVKAFIDSKKKKSKAKTKSGNQISLKLNDVSVLEKISRAVLNQYSSLKPTLKEINWKDARSAKKGFMSIVKFLEEGTK